jgi:hypothetical protein
MVDNNMVIIRAVKGKVHIFHIKETDVESFELKSKPVGIYSVDDFIANLISGKFGNP